MSGAPLSASSGSGELGRVDNGLMLATLSNQSPLLLCRLSAWKNIYIYTHTHIQTHTHTHIFYTFYIYRINTYIYTYMYVYIYRYV